MAETPVKIKQISDSNGDAHDLEAAKLDNSVDVGSTTQPVYFEDGLPKATTYNLQKSVPANANFENTEYQLDSNTTAADGKAYLEFVSFTGGVLTVNTKYLHLNEK